MIPTGVQTRWGPRPNGAILNCRNIHSYPFQQSTQLNNYSERKALEERKWLAVISSFIMQNAIFRQLTIVCCPRICLSAWKSQQISFVLRVKAQNVTVSHSLDKRKSLLCVLCFSPAWGRPPFCHDSQMIVLCWQTPWKLDRVQTRYAFILSSPQSSGKPYRRPTESLGGWLLARWQPGPQKKTSQKLDNENLLIRSWQTWTLWVGCQCCAVCADHGPARCAAARWSHKFTY